MNRGWRRFVFPLVNSALHPAQWPLDNRCLMFSCSAWWENTRTWVPRQTWKPKLTNVWYIIVDHVQHMELLKVTPPWWWWRHSFFNYTRTLLRRVVNDTEGNVVSVSKDRHLRSKIWWFTEFCNSHYISRFAAFFIDRRTKISVAKSCLHVIVVWFLNGKSTRTWTCTTFQEQDSDGRIE